MSWGWLTPVKASTSVSPPLLEKPGPLVLRHSKYEQGVAHAC